MQSPASDPTPEPAPAQATDAAAALEALRPRIAEQARALAALQQALASQQRELERLQQQVEAQRRAAAGSSAPAGDTSVPPSAPAAAAPRVAPIFEQPGVLTPAGRLSIEPSLQYAYASSNRVALVGYTVIPAVLVGLIDVQEVRRSTFAAALTARYGLGPRLEIEAKLPYVYRSDASIGREVLQGSTDPAVLDTTGRGIGDVEVSARYQLNTPTGDDPFFVGSLRVKSRTGRDPFEVPTSTGVLGANGGGVQTALPTGSGFWALQPALTVLLPSDPAVFFGSVSYLHNIVRHDVVSHTDQGAQRIGTVAPGGIFGFNIGMGLSMNDRASFSIGYDHSAIGRTRVNGAVASDSVRLQIATLLLGFSYRLDANRSVGLSVGAGLTRDTPDVTLTLRLPGWL